MSEPIPASHLDLIAGPFHVFLTTIAPDGQPENTVVWCSWDGEYVLVNTAAGRRKDTNVRQNPLVAVAAVDPQDPYRWIDVRGFVESVVPDEGNANIDAHAKLYTGSDSYFGNNAPAEREATEQRVIIKIKPTRVVTVP
jgi:PPOX class probable F420-dependent enzyme